MNAPESHSEARRWLRYSEEDLSAAEILGAREHGTVRHACWLAQQAAEKALKAALILQQIPFPFSHDLDALRNLLPADWRTKAEHPDLAELTEWAVEARLGDWEEGTAADAARAVAQARAVYESVVSDLAKRGS